METWISGKFDIGLVVTRGSADYNQTQTRHGSPQPGLGHHIRKLKVTRTSPGTFGYRGYYMASGLCKTILNKKFLKVYFLFYFKQSEAFRAFISRMQKGYSTSKSFRNHFYSANECKCYPRLHCIFTMLKLKSVSNVLM